MAEDRGISFQEAIRGKNIPIVTLDNKWYQLLDEETRACVKEDETVLNDLIKRQGKLTTEAKEIKKLKKKLMAEIVPMVDDMEQNGNRSLEKEIAEHKRLVEECNEKLSAYEDELLDLPPQIDRINRKLMMFTMQHCYDIMKKNDKEIKNTAAWITRIRIELKKRLIEKQQMEEQNQEMYAYLHDIFGPELLDLFDMQFSSETKS